MTTAQQIATNHRTLANLAARLESLGFTGDAHTEAEHIAQALHRDGWRPVEKVPALRGPGASRRAIDEAKEAAAAAVRGAQDRRTVADRHRQTNENEEQ